MRYDVAYAEPLLEGVLEKRYKRFLADVHLDDGRRMTVHCPNPGSMKSCSTPGSRIRISDSHNPKRKLRHTLEQIRSGRAWVCVNTMLPNPAVHAAVLRGGIGPLDGYDAVRREVGDGAGSRFDLHLTRPGEVCWVEIKNTTLREGREAQFPDAKTERGRKHLGALAARVAAGERAVQLFTISRADVDRFRPAESIDPAYATALRDASAAGVEILALRLRVRPGGIRVGDPIPVDLSPA